MPLPENVYRRFTLTVHTLGGTEMRIMVAGSDRVANAMARVAKKLGVDFLNVDLVVDGNILDKNSMLYKVNIVEDLPKPLITAVVRQAACGHPFCRAINGYCTEEREARRLASIELHGATGFTRSDDDW